MNVPKQEEKISMPGAAVDVQAAATPVGEQRTFADILIHGEPMEQGGELQQQQKQFENIRTEPEAVQQTTTAKEQLEEEKRKRAEEERREREESERRDRERKQQQESESAKGPSVPLTKLESARQQETESFKGPGVSLAKEQQQREGGEREKPSRIDLTRTETGRMETEESSGRRYDEEEEQQESYGIIGMIKDVVAGAAHSILDTAHLVSDRIKDSTNVLIGVTKETAAQGMEKAKEGTEYLAHKTSEGSRSAAEGLKKGTDYTTEKIKSGAEYAADKIKGGAEYTTQMLQSGAEKTAQKAHESREEGVGSEKKVGFEYEEPKEITEKQQKIHESTREGGQSHHEISQREH